MKKANSVFCGVLFAALLCFASLAAACAEHAVPPETEIAEFTLSYTAEEGGRLVGPPTQTVKKGENGAPVTAVAEDGYGFVGWSDGVETAARTDENVTENLSAAARFAKNDTVLFAGGGGTEENPYLIEEPEHLRNMEMFPAAHYRLQNDVVLSAASGGSSAFSPLFDEETMFGGVLDGNGFAIENLAIENKETFYTGLFGRIFYPRLTNCRTAGNVFSKTDGAAYSPACAGGMIGEIGGYNGALADCSAEGNVAAETSDDPHSHAYAGGLVGRLGSARFVNCRATGDISALAPSKDAESFAGGLAGMTRSDSAITNCYAVSRIVDNVSVNKHWGALIGSSEHIEFVNAHWLYVAESGAEYAVGYNADMGVPSGAGAVKHTAIEEFYDLADVLNEGQETPAWEHKTENALPTLISQRD